MTSPLEIYNEWQRRQNAREFEHLGEVVDLVTAPTWSMPYEVSKSGPQT